MMPLDPNIWISNYSSEKNKEAGNKGAAVAGTSVIAAGAATEALDAIAIHFDVSIPPYLKMMALMGLTAAFAYGINRVRNWMKHY